MLSEKVLFAMNDMDDSALEATGRRMGYEQKETAPGGKTLRRLVLLAAVAAVFLAFGLTAYAINLWGIQSLFRTEFRELPEEAVNMIQPHTESAEAEGWSCRITESLCDATTAMVTVTVYGGDRYIIAPTDAMPEDSLWAIGREGDETLAEYAERQGKELLFVGASIQADEGFENLGISHWSLRSENISDSEMAILIIADKTVSDPEISAVCIVNARGAGVTSVEDVERVKIPFTLTEGHATLLGSFTPVDPDAIAGLHFGEATVMETPLGLNVELFITAEDNEDIYKILMPGFEEIESNGSMGETEEAGVWLAQWTMGQGKVDDTLTLHVKDWDKNPVGDILFRKK